MSLSPTQDLLDRIDRLHSILVSELPILLPRTTKTSFELLPTNTIRSTIKSESIIIDELQQYIKKLEREREILLQSYSIILQLLKHNDIDDKTNEIDYDYSEVEH